MLEARPIRTKQDYDEALARVDALMGAPPESAEGRELDLLVDLVVAYEERHVPMGYPSPVEAIEYCMEQRGLEPRDLVPFIGSRTKVSEVLSGTRQITMPMARALHEHLNIPAESLLGRPRVRFDDPWSHVEWTRFPLTTMAKAGWIPDVPNPKEQAEELVGGLIDQAGGRDVAASVMFRKNDHLRANPRTDPYALQAWCWRVLAVANKNPPSADYKSGTVTLEFLKEVARLSRPDNGPRVAADFLAQHGIALVTERHIPRTHLDGAALQLSTGRPVIGLTLRYDRIDNFWFCLLHELAHVGRHLDGTRGGAFVDDLTLRSVAGHTDDPREQEADDWAGEALVPDEIWNSSPARMRPTPMNVLALAAELKVHPAIIAGKVRYERKNYRLLSQFVGSRQIRRQFSGGD